MFQFGAPAPQSAPCSGGRVREGVACVTSKRLRETCAGAPMFGQAPQAGPGGAGLSSIQQLQRLRLLVCLVVISRHSRKATSFVGVSEDLFS